VTEPLLSVGNKTATAAMLHVPARGLWMVDLDLAEDVVLEGRVTVRLGDLTLSGTVDPEHSGAYRSGGRVRVIAGVGGWERPAPRRHFHADQGLKRSTVLSDTARAQGETLQLGAGVDGVIGVDFVRQERDGEGRPIPASAVFARAGAPVWWVDYAGVTHVARQRPAAPIGDVQVLDYDVRLGVAELADIAAIEVGSRLVIDGVEHIVRELRVHVTPARARTRVQLVDVVANRLYDAIATIARQIDAERIPGLYRFRVFRMALDRVELQAVNKVAGLPDILPVPLWPGVAGAWAKLRPGALVLVEFIEGDPARPIVTHYEAKGGAGWLPVEVLLDASDVVHVGPSSAQIRLGGDEGQPVHRVGDPGKGPLIVALGPVITLTNPDGSTVVLTDASGISQWSVTGTADPPGQTTTEATGGSGRVTSE
jgi:hypothetical protein